MGIGAWAWKFLTTIQCLFSFREASGHRILKWRRVALEHHKIILSKFLSVELLEVAAWTWQTVVTSFLDVVDEKLLHVVSTNTNAELFISLTAILTKGVSEVVAEWGWQFSLLILVWVVVESLRRVEEWSTVSIIFPLAEQVVRVISDFLVQSFVHREPFTLREHVHLFRRRVIDRGVVFVGHIFY